MHRDEERRECPRMEGGVLGFLQRWAPAMVFLLGLAFSFGQAKQAMSSLGKLPELIEVNRVQVQANKEQILVMQEQTRSMNALLTEIRDELRTIHKVSK